MIAMVECFLSVRALSVFSRSIHIVINFLVVTCLHLLVGGDTLYTRLTLPNIICFLCVATKLYTIATGAAFHLVSAMIPMDIAGLAACF